MKHESVYLLESCNPEGAETLGIFSSLISVKSLLRKLPDNYSYYITEFQLDRNLCREYDRDKLFDFKTRIHEYYGKKVNFKTLNKTSFDESRDYFKTSKQKTVFFLYDIKGRNDYVNMGVFSSHRKAVKSLKNFPKRYNYQVIMYPVDGKLISGYEPSQTTFPMHWHYVTEYFFEDETETHHHLCVTWPFMEYFEITNIPADKLDETLKILDGLKKGPLKKNASDYAIEWESFAKLNLK